WAMLALAPGRLPATAREDPFAAAIAALERSGKPREAQASYQAMSERWPGNLTALIGLGNTTYASGDLAGAESAFRRAAETHPESGAALNNLAFVLAQRGKLEEAERLARAALVLGGPTEAEARKTLDGILARKASGR